MSAIEVERHDEVEAHIHATLMSELTKLMHKTGLPAMTLLTLSARSLGMIYREMADAHSGIDGCPCGWRPEPQVEADLLGASLVSACERWRDRDLRVMRIAGTA